MFVENLKTGDLIFELDSLGSVAHVSIYAGKRQGLHYQVHATLGRYKSIMITYLPEGNYNVIRAKDNHLALLATGIMYRWVEHQVLFANDIKRNKLHATLENLGGIDCQNEEVVQEQFGKAEYGIKSIQLYVTMLKALPYVPQVGGERMGLFCSEAIIASFNIAMIISNEELFRQLYEAPIGLSVTAILEHRIRELDNPLPFDASSTYPGGMYKHCIEDAQHWDNLGSLSHQEDLQVVLAQQKDDWLEFRKLLLKDAPIQVENYMHLERAVTPIVELLDSENQSDSPIPRHRSPQHLLLWSHSQEIPRSSPVHFLGQS